MRKKIGVLCVFMLTLGLTSPVFALRTGSWTLAEGALEDGSWFEQQITLPTGQTTSLLSAQADCFQWQISDLMLISMLPNPDGTQSATYVGGTLLLAEASDLWGEALSLGVSACDINQFTPTGLNVSLNIFGAYNDFDILISAEFQGIFGQNLDYNPVAKYIGGQGFASVKLDVSRSASVPEPGTLLLFGIGIFGVASFNRKRIS